MKKTPSINVFNAGELGHYEDVRVDMKHYHEGCRVIENMMPLSEGPIQRMPGTVFAAEVTVATPWSPPSIDCLWAWFKFDEESGTVITDYGPLSSNGVLNNTTPAGQAKFWGVPGFGHNDTGAPIQWAKRVLGSASRPVDYVSVIGFVRPQGHVSNSEFTGCWQLGQGGNNNWLRIMWSKISPYRWGVTNPNILGANYASVSPDFGDWYCVFATASPKTGVEAVKLYIRKSGDGAFTKIIDVATILSYTGSQGSIAAFGGNNVSWEMDGGDVFYYACTDPSGIITLEQADTLYNNFKSRYGMS